jgi:DNA modification methylase
VSLTRGHRYWRLHSRQSENRLNPNHHRRSAREEGGLIQTELFDEWTRGRRVSSLGTNAGAGRLPFQDWHHFKEAFPPELVRRVVEMSPIEVRNCLDPFGGSGTTALCAQFLGISATTIEVNPFLADLIQAKLTHYDADHLASELGELERRLGQKVLRSAIDVEHLPETFVEPGRNGRWLFHSHVADELGRLMAAISQVRNVEERRFFRVILGGVLVDVSNVVVSGKGRRYRRDWETRHEKGASTDLFIQRARLAIMDVHRFADRPRVRAYVRRGDARRVRLRRREDLVVFSPPYPNSFDYTDVYNVELWMLGYLQVRMDNVDLRRSTLSSHVQISRNFAAPPQGSSTLDRVVTALQRKREDMWSPWIPSMVGAYFSDLLRVINRVWLALAPNGLCCVVIGDSRYAGVRVESAKILKELAATTGWSIDVSEEFRVMKSSAQQGNREELAETLVVMRRAGDYSVASR